jgi:hypothetical protein
MDRLKAFRDPSHFIGRSDKDRIVTRRRSLEAVIANLEEADGAASLRYLLFECRSVAISLARPKLIWRSKVPAQILPITSIANHFAAVHCNQCQLPMHQCKSS